MMPLSLMNNSAINKSVPVDGNVSKPVVCPLNGYVKETASWRVKNQLICMV